MFDRYHRRKLHAEAVRYAANGWPVAPLAIPRNGVCPCGGNCLDPHVVGEVVRDGYRAAEVWREPGRRTGLWTPRPRAVADRGRRLDTSELAAGALRHWTSDDLLPAEQSTETKPRGLGAEVKPGGVESDVEPGGLGAGMWLGGGAEVKPGGVESDVEPGGLGAGMWLGGGAEVKPGGVESDVEPGGLGVGMWLGGGAEVKPGGVESEAEPGGLGVGMWLGGGAEMKPGGVESDAKAGGLSAEMWSGGVGAGVELGGKLGGVGSGVGLGGGDAEVMAAGGAEVEPRGSETRGKPGGVGAEVMAGGGAGRWEIALVAEWFDVMELPAEYGAVLNHQVKATCPTAIAPATRRWSFFVVQGSVPREQVVAAGGVLHSGPKDWVPAPGTWLEETGTTRWLVHPYLTEWRPYQRRDPIDLIFL